MSSSTPSQTAPYGGPWHRIELQALSELSSRFDEVISYYSEFLRDDDWGWGRAKQLVPFTKEDIPNIIKIQRGITRLLWLQLKYYDVDSPLMLQGWKEYRLQANKLFDMIESSQKRWDELMPFPFNNIIEYQYRPTRNMVPLGS